MSGLGYLAEGAGALFKIGEALQVIVHFDLATSGDIEGLDSVLAVTDIRANDIDTLERL
jgi:hypothetical protein